MEPAQFFLISQASHNGIVRLSSSYRGGGGAVLPLSASVEIMKIKSDLVWSAFNGTSHDSVSY